MFFEALACLINHVSNLQFDHGTDGSAGLLLFGGIGVVVLGLLSGMVPEAGSLELFELHDAGFESVIDIVRLIGEVVSNVGDLGFERLMRTDGVSIELCVGFVGFVFKQAGTDFPAEVKAGKGRIGRFKLFDAA